MIDSLKLVHEVHLEVSDSCNLQCNYCYYVSKKKKVEDFPLSQLERIIRQLFCRSCEDVNIVFHGGEPLLRSAEWYKEACDIITSLAHEYQKKVRFQLQTNGTLLSERHVDVFQKYNVIVSVSLDGPAIIHNAVRGRFHKSISAIRALQKSHIFGSVISVISKHNFRDVSKIVELLVELNVKSYHFNIASIVGSNKELVLSSEEITEYYVGAYLSFIQFYEMICDWMLLGKMRRFVTGIIPKFHCDSPICGAGLYKVHVLPNGSFYPCGSCVSTNEARKVFLQGNLFEKQSHDQEYFLSEFHSLYFTKRGQCENCTANIICDFFCSAFDTFDPHTANNRCIATQNFYSFLLSQEREKIQKIVDFYNNKNV